MVAKVICAETGRRVEDILILIMCILACIQYRNFCSCLSAAQMKAHGKRNKLPPTVTRCFIDKD
jgi:hypothetical protein